MKPKDFIEFLKLPPNILSAICLVSGIVLFIPDKFAKKYICMNLEIIMVLLYL